MPDLKGIDESRRAAPPIAGFVYQFYLSLYAWMNLAEDEALFLEKAEDFEIHTTGTAETVQVKHTQAKITLNNQDIVKALNNYCDYKTKNPDKRIQFRFITTSLPTVEKGNPFGDGIKGLDLWKKKEKTEDEIDGLKRFLLNHSLIGDALKAFIQSSKNLEADLFSCIFWDMGQKSLETICPTIENAIIYHGLKFLIPASDSKKAVPILLYKIIEEIIKPQHANGLSLAGFYLAYDEAVTGFAKTAQILQEQASIQKNASETGIAQILQERNYAQSAFSTPPPIPQLALNRKEYTDKIREKLLQQNVIFAVGSSGVGKSTIAAQYVSSSNEPCNWIDLRSLEALRIKQIIKSLNIYIQDKSNEVFILDDLDLRKDFKTYEHELKNFLFNARIRNNRVIVTSQTNPSNQILLDTWLDEGSIVHIENFSLEEIQELVLTCGCPANIKPEAWANIIYLETSGHPQLARAKIRGLQLKNWTLSEADLLGSPEVKKEKKDVREQIISAIPETARELAYRLSLHAGIFRKRMAEGVSKVSPNIHRYGEAFEILVGPWLEEVTSEYYRVSPLLSGQGSEIFNIDKTREMYSAFCATYLTQEEPLNQKEVSYLFMHGLLSQNEEILAIIAKNNIEYVLRNGDDHTSLRYIADELFWFYTYATKKGQKIFSKNLYISYLLRFLQFTFFKNSSEKEDATLYAELLLDDAQEAIDGLGLEDVMKASTQTWVYISILTTMNKRICPTVAIPLIPKLMRLAENGEVTLPELGMSVYDPGTQVSGFVQVISFRSTGIEDFRKTLLSIDALSSDDKKIVLDGLKEEQETIRTLCNTAWWKEIKGHENNDISNLINVYIEGIAYAEKWGFKLLKVHCILCISVLYDEYGHDANSAISILDKNKEIFSSFESLLFYQRAKILFNSKSYEEAAPFWDKTLALRDKLDNIDRIFAFRNAAISFSKAGNWNKAKHIMSDYLGELYKIREKFPSFYPFIDIGIKADIAFMEMKLDDWNTALQGFSKALQELEGFYDTENTNPRYVALYARIGHIITWIAQSIDGNWMHNEKLADPPPCCASDPDDAGLIKEYTMKPPVFLWTVLYDLERAKGIDVGITDLFYERVKATNYLSPKVMFALKEIRIAFEKSELDNIIELASRIPQIRRTIKKLEKENVNANVATEEHLVPFSEISAAEKEEAVLPILFTACFYLLIRGKDLKPYLEKWDKQINAIFLNQHQCKSSELFSYAKHFRKSGKAPKFSSADALEQYKDVLQATPLILHHENIDVVTLFRLHFYTLNILCNLVFQEVVEDELLKYVCESWLYAIQNKTFALRNPRINLPTIEAACTSREKKGLGKIAIILLSVQEALNIDLPKQSIDFLNRIATQEKTIILK